MTPQHEKFLQRLARSRTAVLAVAKWLRSKGQMVSVPETQFAPSARSAAKYVDSGDILLRDGRRIEVKHIGLDFTDAASWPFKEYFVSNEAAVKRARDVAAYITISNDLAAVAICRPDQSRDAWYVKEALAKNTGNVEKFVACPLSHIEFEVLEAPERGRPSSAGDMGLPDLQKLVEKYGSYPAIPAHEWAAYDAAYQRLRPKKLNPFGSQP